MTSDFNERNSQRDLEDKLAMIGERIIAAMEMAGEKFIIASREQPGDHSQGFYEDQTTNLRNSIGYFIFKDGELIKSQMGNVGANQEVLQELIKKTGYQLIGMAGMNYASYVESRGYNVISIQADACMVDLTAYFEEIKKFIDAA